MAESLETNTEGKKLENIFEDGWKSFDELEMTSLAFSSAEFQNKVKQTMECFEIATRIVSQVDMFSPNELIDEVSTDSLQFMLLPFFLGKLTLKLNSHDRLEVLKVAEVYFNDFIKRCQEYELCDDKRNQELEKSTTANRNSNEMAELMRAAHARNDKIAQFRKKKELEDHIKNMKEVIRTKIVDDEVKREFYLKVLQKSIIETNEEIESVKLEKQMVEMKKLHALSADKEESIGANSSAHGRHHHQHHHANSQPKPLRPFIITRDANQKAVFGMGYPSLPIMTVDEFYKQRVEEGIFPDEEKVAQMNLAQAAAIAKDENEKEDEEKAVLEEKIENDDPENLARMRRMDEYKDVVRRGDGNRYNRS